MAEYVEIPKEEDKKGTPWSITISLNMMRAVVIFFFILGFLLGRVIYN